MPGNTGSDHRYHHVDVHNKQTTSSTCDAAVDSSVLFQLIWREYAGVGRGQRPRAQGLIKVYITRSEKGRKFPHALLLLVGC